MATCSSSHAKRMPTSLGAGKRLGLVSSSAARAGCDPWTSLANAVVVEFGFRKDLVVVARQIHWKEDGGEDRAVLRTKRRDARGEPLAGQSGVVARRGEIDVEVAAFFEGVGIGIKAQVGLVEQTRASRQATAGAERSSGSLPNRRCGGPDRDREAWIRRRARRIRSRHR